MLAKILWNILSYWIVIAFCIFCIACRDITSEAHPPLVNALVQKSDFSTEWRWRNVPTSNDDSQLWVDQVKFEDNEVTERKSLRLTGVYSKKYSVEIFHLLIYWKRPVTEDTLTSLRPELAGSNIPVNIVKLGNYTRSKCVTNIDPNIGNATCHTSVGYHHVTSVVDIFIISDNEIEPQILEMILNEALIAVDNRIREVDDQS